MFAKIIRWLRAYDAQAKKREELRQTKLRINERFLGIKEELRKMDTRDSTATIFYMDNLLDIADREKIEMFVETFDKNPAQTIADSAKAYEEQTQADFKRIFEKA